MCGKESSSRTKNRFLAVSAPGSPQDFSGNRQRWPTVQNLADSAISPKARLPRLNSQFKPRYPAGGYSPVHHRPSENYFSGDFSTPNAHKSGPNPAFLLCKQTVETGVFRQSDRPVKKIFDKPELRRLVKFVALRLHLTIPQDPANAPRKRKLFLKYIIMGYFCACRLCQRLIPAGKPSGGI